MPDGTKKDPNPANRISNAVEAVISNYQDRIWQAQGIITLAHGHLLEEPDDTTPVWQALEGALAILQETSPRMEAIVIQRDADEWERKQAEEAAQEGEAS